MKQTIVDGKKVVYYNNKKTVPAVKTIQNVYRSINDNKSIPLLFMTREQYLQQYINNQEKKKGIHYTAQQKRQYIKQEKPFYNIVESRYTTKHNPYYPPAVVFFNDRKITPGQFRRDAQHEYGHEVVEKNHLRLKNEEGYCNKMMKRRK